MKQTLLLLVRFAQVLADHLCATMTPALRGPSLPAGEDVKGQRKFFGNFPYPYMNGLLHLGHGFSLSKVVAQSPNSSSSCKPESACMGSKLNAPKPAAAFLISFCKQKASDSPIKKQMIAQSIFAVLHSGGGCPVIRFAPSHEIPLCITA